MATLRVQGPAGKAAQMNVATTPVHGRTVLYRRIGETGWQLLSGQGLQHVGPLGGEYEFKVLLYRRPWVLNARAQAEGGTYALLPEESSEARGLQPGFLVDPDEIEFSVAYEASS